nr:reverse transcriptase domain-containing protein [Tanacetum cinerariifolium]
MSKCSSAKNLFPPLDNPEFTIRRRSRTDLTLLNNSEIAAEGNGDLPVPDLQTMEEVCQPSLNGRGSPISPIAIQAMNFGLKNDMIQQVQNSCQFHGLPGEDANKHLDKLLHVTQSIKANGVTDDALCLYLFPHSLTHHATVRFDRFPRNSINTFEQMAKMFLEKYFPPSMGTKLRNEITNFCQRPDESLFEAWERYKLYIDRCPNHNMFPVTQIDTFYNSLNLRHRDTINVAAGGTFMKRRPEECYDLIENMTAHHNNWDTSAQRSESSSSITSSFDTEITALKAEMAEINKNLMRVLQVNQQLKAVTLNGETCGGPHSFNDCPATVGQTQNVYTAGAYQGNTITNPKEDLKGITTRSGTAYQGPTIPTTSSSLPLVVERETEATKDMVHPTNNGSTEDVQPPVVQSESPILNSEPVVTPIIEPLLLHFADALILMPKFGLSIKSLLTNKDKLCELSRTLLNEHCSTVLLKKLPKKLGDLSKFLIPCDFPGMAECLALADLDASFNLMPLSVWNKLSLPELTLTLMTLELADRSISRSIGVAEDVYDKVGKFYFSADFVVVDFDADPRVPLILGRSFLKTGRALIEVFEGELTLRVGKEAITFNLNQTSRYSANYNDMTKNQIDVIDMAYEEYSQEVLSFFDVITNGNPTPYYDPIVSTNSTTLTPFKNSDFLLEEVDVFLALEDDPTSPENDDPSLSPPNQGNYLPQVRNELKICEAKSDKSSIDEPPEIELKDLPPYLEYVFLEDDDKFLVIFAKYLSVEDKTALITVLKSHKRAIAWKLFDIKGIDPEFCTHKFLMEEDFKPAVQHQRRVYPKIHDVIKNEVIKLLDAGLIYPISDSPWRLAGNQYYCFLDGFFGYFQIPIDPKDQEKTTFTSPYGTSAYHYMPFGLCNAPGTFQRCMMAIFHDMIEKTMKVFMDDFSVFDNSFQTCLFPSCRGNKYILVVVDYLSKWVEAKALPTNDARFAKVMLKFDVTHRLATPYHPQTSGQVEVSNHGLKRILERTVGENRASWSDKLDDALWAFLTSYKTTIGCTPYKLVYGKTCHLPIELEPKANWALKHANFDLQTAGDHIKVQLNELNELCDQAYEKSLIYKEKTKRLHDSKTKDRVFNIGDRDLLFNSILKIFSSKLKSYWSGLFTISYVFPYGTVELSQPDMPNFKVNGHKLKHYFGEDVPKMVVPDLQTFPKDQRIRGLGQAKRP